jgi:hypothetical protein
MRRRELGIDPVFGVRKHSLMKRTILFHYMLGGAVLLLSGIGLVVNGQEKRPETKPYQNNAEHEETKTTKTPDVRVGDINQETAQTKKNGAEGKSENYFLRLFSPENLPAIGLLIVGAIGTGLALKTLRAIERQTTALVESQRSRLVALPYGDVAKTFADKSARRVEIELHNKGLTPAYDILYETWIEILPFPFADFTSSATRFHCHDPLVLYPNVDPVIINIPIGKAVSAYEMSAIASLKLYVCVRIHVTFRDAFGPRESDFAFYLMAKGVGFLPKYNSSK